MTAANMSISNVTPVFQAMPLRWMPMSTPESAARPQERIHTMRTTESTLMPEAAASAALSDTARVARPSLVQ